MDKPTKDNSWRNNTRSEVSKIDIESLSFLHGTLWRSQRISYTFSDWQRTELCTSATRVHFGCSHEAVRSYETSCVPISWPKQQVHQVCLQLRETVLKIIKKSTISCFDNRTREAPKYYTWIVVGSNVWPYAKMNYWLVK